MPDIDRRAIAFECLLDDLDCPVDPGAEAARGSDQQVECRALGSGVCGGGIGSLKGRVHVAPSSASAASSLGRTGSFNSRTALMMLRARAFFALSAVAALAACSNEGELVVDQGVGLAVAGVGHRTILPVVMSRRTVARVPVSLRLLPGAKR